GVRAKLGSKSYFARYGLKRQDLGEVAHDYPDVLRSGFSITIPIPSTTASIRLEAIALGGSWEHFFEYRVAEKGRNASRIVVSHLASPDSVTEHAPLLLYPDITSAEVTSVLQPLIKQHLQHWQSRRPLFTLITPISGIVPRWIAEAGASLLNQTFPHWEWCLVVDEMRRHIVQEILEPLAA